MDPWQEQYDGGSSEKERVLFDQLALDIMDVQLKIRQRNRASGIERAFHAKTILGVTNATLRVLPDVPEGLRAGYFAPGCEYETTVRLSNASGAPQPDYAQDLRGAALRIKVSPAEFRDLLMTNFPASHARNARQFVAFAKAMSHGKLVGALLLPFKVGLSEAIRMLRNIKEALARPVRSLALETYWSRGAMLWADAGPVRYLLRPVAGGADAPDPSATDADYLHREIAGRLRNGDIVFELCVQPYVDAARTPIEDASVEWTEQVSPPVPVARLTIPKQDIDAADGRACQRLVEQIAFNPWHTTGAFRPLGNINRARKAAYRASSAHRLGYRFREKVPLRNVIFGKLLEWLFEVVNRLRPWYRLGTNLAALNVVFLRDILRAKNLIDTEAREAPPMPEPIPPSIPEEVRTARAFDGSYNDLSVPRMGSVGSTFGRNMPPVYRPAQFDVPNPITVSRELLFRDSFIPARSLNLLAAAWIQFQVHDWVNHDRHPLGEDDVVVPLPDGGNWQSSVGGPQESRMRIAGNKVHATAPGGCPVFANIATPWWDGSEVYGPDEARAQSLRAGAFLRLVNGYLPDDVNGIGVTGFNENWWLGLSLMHTLFAREHNTVAQALRSAYPSMDDERVYQIARLVVSALIAKIHTIEWTPAIVATKAVDIALHSNWYGAPKDWLTQLSLWLVDAHSLRGIPQTLPNHHTAPYSMTEEFATVYRMHPLIPDDYRFCDYRDGSVRETTTFQEIQGRVTDDVMRRLGLTDVIYSFGIAHPGAITLHNYPRSLQRFERINGELIDLSVVDLVRDRRRGVPRYNDFREGLHKPRIRHWEELSPDPESVRRLRKLYGSIDAVDTMVGLFAEPPPEGFGFSDTAFRIFIVMASRRMQSDRFLTVDFRPEIYSPLGIDWVASNGMTSVILRHCPELAGILPRSASAFAPFRPVAT